MLTPEEVREHLDSLAKPAGSLGRLEWLATRLCLTQRTLAPQTRPRRLVVFAADHGVARSGVTAWPSQVTEVIVRAIVDGVAGSSVLADATATELRLVDVGTVGQELTEGSRYSCDRIHLGSRDLSVEPALTEDDFRRAWLVGEREAGVAAREGCRVVAAGEVGVANTTPASCLTVLLTGACPEDAVGRGAGADDQILARKIAVVTEAAERARSRFAAQPRDAIAAVGGLEIAAMAGFYAMAAELGLTVILDGFVATAAALAAEHLRPGTADQMIAAHRSAEPGHQGALAHLGLQPVLDGWGMRLGEGTGALLVMPLLDAAASVVTSMARLDALVAKP